MTARLPEAERGIVAGIAGLIAERDDFLITTHTTMDGDSIASELALFLRLRRMGKRVAAVNQDPVPRIYRFLPGVGSVEVLDESRRAAPGTAFVLDCGSLARTGRVEPLLADACVVNIDHHFSNARYGRFNWVESSYAACGEMVFHLLSALGPVDRDEAACLYTAILTDTGSFHYHFGPATFGVAQDLLETGIDPEKIAQKVYMERPLKASELLVRSMGTFRFDAPTRSCRMWITRDMYEATGTAEEDTEGFIDFLRNVSEAEMVFILKEKDGGVKASFRSRGSRDVEELAREFGGGGHREASGCFIEKVGAAGAEERIMEAIRRRWTG